MTTARTSAALALVVAGLTLTTTAALDTARAADFEVVYKSCPEDNYYADYDKLSKLKEPPTNCKGSADKLAVGRMVLRLKGDIAPGDADRLKAFLDSQIKAVSGYGYDADGTFITVDMAGDGGSLAGATELGGFFADKYIQTRIVRGSTCAGPCALAFMGGRAQWTRLTRLAIDRRLETGGQLIFRSPLYPPGDAAGQPQAIRDAAGIVQTYAARNDIPPLILAKILSLKQDESFPIDSVFWAKVANITVDGVLPMTKPGDDDNISACLSQVDWTYGLDGEYDEPPQLKNGSDWDEGKIVYRSDSYMLVAAVWASEGYDYWCALNTSRTAEVKIPRQKVRAILGKWQGRNSLLHGDTNEDIDLKGNQIYFSRAPNGFSPTRAQNSLDLLLRDPQTKLATIADPDFKWNPWAKWDPWFELDGP
ncbi:MAG TPA: hypothetical protein VHX43_12685 [Xanthobacteraceae bacterium]|jgi:hypothetical protein|nr:hypothetical protein [Xanthobacteraceae bacterium]